MRLGKVSHWAFQLYRLSHVARRKRLHPATCGLRPAAKECKVPANLVLLPKRLIMHVRRSWRQAALLIAIACAIFVLGCGLGAVAVRQGVLSPPNVNLELGRMRVVGIRSNSPDCTRLIIPGCSGLEPANITHIYTLWLFRQNERDSWSQPIVSKLLSVRIGLGR